MSVTDVRHSYIHNKYAKYRLRLTYCYYHEQMSLVRH